MTRSLASTIENFHGYGRTDLATALDMSASGGTFGTYLSRLRSAGLLDERNGVIHAAKSLMEAA